MTKLFTIHDKVDWINYVQKAAQFDCYHTWSYHALEHRDMPILFVFENGEDYIAFPMIKRKINGTGYFDIGCVYGYSGPISNKKIAELDASFIESYKSAFLEFLSAENIVSVFMRLHPFFEQEALLEKFGGVHENGVTVVLDLSVPIEDQRKGYNGNTRDLIKRCWKNCYKMEEETGPEAIALFSSIYLENMKRVNASGYYLFSDEYFKGIVNSKEFDTRILFVYDGETPIASTLLMCTNGIIQGHLMCTLDKYLKYSPARFLVDEITQLGRKMGMRFFNLGGGLGFKEGSLLNWKLAFTRNTLDFKTWRFIANPTVYHQLVHEKGIDKNAEIDFFPLYRYV